MKLNIRIFHMFLIMILNLMVQSTLSMEPPEASGPPQPAVRSMSTTLPLEAQRFFIEMGHETLKNIIIDDHYDVSKSGLYDRFSSRYPVILETAKYSKLAEWMPSKLIRGYFASKDETYVTTRKNHLTALIGICWAMVDLAKDQKDFFERGSFSIIDPRNRLSNFFLEYSRLTTGHDVPKEHSYWATNSNFAYPRDPERHGSSHHHGHCPESQFGVDIRLDPQGSVLKMLPFDGTHFLFAQLDIGGQEEPLLFLKLEHMGMGSIPAILLHGFNFFQSQSTVSSEARREKDVDNAIVRAFADLLPDPQALDRFKTIRAMYQEATRLCNQSDPSKKKELVPIKLGDGELESFHIVGGPDEDEQNRTHIKAQSFVKMVDALYPNGNNHLRVGNEVIIDLRPVWAIYK